MYALFAGKVSCILSSAFKIVPLNVSTNCFSSVLKCFFVWAVDSACQTYPNANLKRFYAPESFTFLWRRDPFLVWTLVAFALIAFDTGPSYDFPFIVTVFKLYCLPYWYCDKRIATTLLLYCIVIYHNTVMLTSSSAFPLYRSPICLVYMITVL